MQKETLHGKANIDMNINIKKETICIETYDVSVNIRFKDENETNYIIKLKCMY